MSTVHEHIHLVEIFWSLRIIWTYKIADNGWNYKIQSLACIWKEELAEMNLSHVSRIHQGHNK